MSATRGSVTAEGIETVEQADILRGMGCPTPGPLAVVIAQLQEQQRATGTAFTP